MAQKDPITQFGELAAILGATAIPGEIVQSALKGVINDREPEEAKEDLISHITSNTSLTRPVTEGLVTNAIAKASKVADTPGAPAVTPEAKKAKKVDTVTKDLSDTLSNLSSADYALELTNPSMLYGAARGWFALALLIVAGGAAYFLGQQPAATANQLTSDQAIALGVVAGLAVLAALILVMGYKNVVIKGTRGAGATTGGTGPASSRVKGTTTTS
jgi:hypothetical protein